MLLVLGPAQPSHWFPRFLFAPAPLPKFAESSMRARSGWTAASGISPEALRWILRTPTESNLINWSLASLAAFPLLSPRLSQCHCPGLPRSKWISHSGISRWSHRHKQSCQWCQCSSPAPSHTMPHPSTTSEGSHFYFHFHFHFRLHRRKLPQHQDQLPSRKLALQSLCQAFHGSEAVEPYQESLYQMTGELFGEPWSQYSGTMTSI